MLTTYTYNYLYYTTQNLGQESPQTRPEGASSIPCLVVYVWKPDVTWPIPGCNRPMSVTLHVPVRANRTPNRCRLASCRAGRRSARRRRTSQAVVRAQMGGVNEGCWPPKGSVFVSTWPRWMGLELSTNQATEYSNMTNPFPESYI